jgi:hypothetical protein
MDSIKIVDAAIAGDKEAFMAAFNSAMADKVTDALELKKVELASTLVSPETQTTEVEVTDETNGIAAEVDGASSIVEPVQS